MIVGSRAFLDMCIMAHFGRGQACSMPILHGLMSLTSNLKERSVRSLRRMHTDSQRSFILLLASSVIYSRASPCAMDRPSVPCVCACYYILRAGIVFFLFARECCAVRTQGESSPPHASMHHITVNAAIRATDHVSASRAFASLELAQHTAV